MRAMEIFFSTLPRFTKDDAPRVEQSSDEAVVKIDSKTIAKASLPSPDNKTALPHLASLTLPINTVTDVIVFYTGCCGQGKGDYSACGTLVEMISSYVPYPVILLSNVRGVEQFNSLYQNKNQTASINGKRVEIMALYDFRDNQHKFAVKGYVEHGCSRLGSRYMQEYVLKNSDAKAAIVLTMIQGGLPNYISEAKTSYSYTPSASVFAAGFGPRMSGVPFARTSSVAFSEKPQESKAPSLERLLSLNPRYGFAYVTSRIDFWSGVNPREEAALYLKDYMTIIDDLNESRVVLCFGSEEIAKLAAEKFSIESGKKVFFINSSEAGLSDIEADKNSFIVVFSSGVSNEIFKMFMQKASRVVALPGASSAVEAMGAKKLVFYECVKESTSFMGGFHDLMTAPLHADLIELGQLLLHEKRLAREQLVLLKKHLKDELLCNAFADIAQMRVQSESKRLTRSLLSWLQITPKVTPEKVIESTPCLYQ